MKKIAFFMPEYALPIPAIQGGAIEELVEILINEMKQKTIINYSLDQEKNKKRFLEIIK